MPSGFDHFRTAGSFETGARILPVVPETTGRILVVLRKGQRQSGLSALHDRAGLDLASVASTADFAAERGITSETLAAAPTVVFEHLGVAVIRPAPDQFEAMAAAAMAIPALEASEPEQVEYALADGLIEPGRAASADYLRGYQAAVNQLIDGLLGGARVSQRGVVGAAIAAPDLSQATWGLYAARVVESQFSGRGIRVAVLDTGMDLNHPDFAGRVITGQSFIQGEGVQDGNGHGTHVIGTACGPLRPAILPRYGVAYEAEIFAGKVLSNQGSGADGGILAGIDWAISNRCRIVSMSLGARVSVGQRPSAVYEEVGQRALDAGTLIIAAAGNDSSRPLVTAPVSRPANSRTILAVAAVDPADAVAAFSNGGINPNGGEVDTAAAGVGVYSSVPMPRRYAVFNGTSMATPHVAGIAALHLQATPNLSAPDLAQLLFRTARPLPLPGRDVGAGLVQAP
jgi:subtilisin family serine protease